MIAYKSKILTSVALASALALSGLSSGCTVHGRTRGGVVYYEPPPPRSTYVQARPGYVWVEGRWVWDDYGSDWVWYDGYWVQDNPGYYYVAGRWDRRGSRYVWVEPRWVSRSNASVTVRVRDHGQPTKVKVKTNSGQRVPSRPGPRR